MQLLSRFVQRFRESVRFKLLVLVLAPLLVVLPILVAGLLYWGNTGYQKLLVFKINSDLKVAHEYFERVIAGVGHRVRGLAESERLLRALRDQDSAAVLSLLQNAEISSDLDFLNVLDAHGRLLYSSSEQATRGTDYSTWPLVRAALAGEDQTAIDIFSSEQLAAIHFALRDRALMQILPTQDATASDRKEEDRGMVIHSAAPLYDEQNQRIGVLQGGLLLNRNLEFVDYINSIVYSEGSLPLGSKGTTTLFLDDVRIATNVRLFEGERALGTRVSQNVYDHVLRRGGVWLDRAYVVNDWYVSGYEPIQDSQGRRVGMLYVGYLETPFSAAKQYVLLGLVTLFLVVSLLGAALFLRWAGRLLGPLERMDAVMSEVEAGRLDARVGPVASRDEIGRLALRFDELLAALENRNAELKRWGDELDRMVAERTRELEEANQALRDAQRHLVMSEKLAAIGQLTAGVTHEINNPIAVIQGNLDLVRELLGERAAPVMREIRLIDEQVNRIRLIVTKLLQFARPSDFAGYVEKVDVNGVLADSLVLVQHANRTGAIKVRQDLAATRRVEINRNELQQVFINIVMNAMHAMPKGGTLTLSSRDWGEKGVSVAIRDTGHGIRPEDLQRVFDPFFTTDKQHGTGLGLSISYALAERYGGRISVESEPGAGATFTVWLLGEAKFASEDLERREMHQRPSATRSGTYGPSD